MEMMDTVRAIDHIDRIMEGTGVIHNMTLMLLDIHVHIQDTMNQLDMQHLQKVNFREYLKITIYYNRQRRN